MRREELFQAIGQIDDTLIAKSGKRAKRKKRARKKSRPNCKKLMAKS